LGQEKEEKRAGPEGRVKQINKRKKAHGSQERSQKEKGLIETARRRARERPKGPGSILWEEKTKGPGGGKGGGRKPSRAEGGKRKGTN